MQIFPLIAVYSITIYVYCTKQSFLEVEKGKGVVSPVQAERSVTEEGSELASRKQELLELKNELETVVSILRRFPAKKAWAAAQALDDAAFYAQYDQQWVPYKIFDHSNLKKKIDRLEAEIERKKIKLEAQIDRKNNEIERKKIRLEAEIERIKVITFLREKAALEENLSKKARKEKISESLNGLETRPGDENLSRNLSPKQSSSTEKLSKSCNILHNLYTYIYTCIYMYTSFISSISGHFLLD